MRASAPPGAVMSSRPAVRKLRATIPSAVPPPRRVSQRWRRSREEPGPRLRWPPRPQPSRWQPMSVAATSPACAARAMLVLVSNGERKTVIELLHSECITATFVETARQALESVRDSARTSCSRMKASPAPANCSKDCAAILDGLRAGGAAGGLRARAFVSASSARCGRLLARPFEERAAFARGRSRDRHAGGDHERTGGVRRRHGGRRSLIAWPTRFVAAWWTPSKRGRELRVPLGEGAEVLAAAWAAIARVRAFVSEQSAGRVRFTELPSRSTPALLSVGGALGARPLLEASEPARSAVSCLAGASWWSMTTPV